MGERDLGPTDESWRAVPRHEGAYEVSSIGRVRNARTLQVLIPWLRRGYRTVGLHVGHKRRFVSVHSLVLEAFSGPRPANAQGAHLDGDPLNNRVDNLKWCSAKENAAHKFSHGTNRAGAESCKSKFTDRQVAIIRDIAAAGISRRGIADLLGTDLTTISHIVERRTYAADASPPSGDHPSRENLICRCGGNVDAWKGNGPRGRYVYCECDRCHRKTGHFSTRFWAEVAWRDSDGSPKGGDACGSVHDSAGRQASPNPNQDTLNDR